MGGLISVDDALATVLDRVSVLSVEQVHVGQALDRVLAEDILAATSVPPFANSAMDGYAVRSADTTGASPGSPVTLTPIEDIPAGMTSSRALDPGQAARIMTGAPLPPGADAVVPVEQTDDRWQPDGRAALPERVAVYRAAAAGDNVRAAGEDIRAGQVVLRRGAVLRPQDIGVLVSLGRARNPVQRPPRVANLSPGAELVDVDRSLAPGQIYNSNGYVLAGLVTQCGGVAIRLPVARDNLDEVRRLLREALAHAPDFIVTSAGVSVGTHEVVRTVVEEMGHVAIWRVNVRPGKPLAFGDVGGVPFFGLPGNPVSAMVTFDIFVRPALRKAGGADPHALPVVIAVLGEDVSLDGRRTYLRVTLSEQEGRLVARATGTQSSGALMSLVLADGLLIIPEGKIEARAGDRFPVRLLRQVYRTV